MELYVRGRRADASVSGVRCAITTLALVLAVACLVSSGAAVAGATAPFRGMVTDALGRPIPGALVTLKNSSGQIVLALQTDKDGKFQAPSPVGGIYTFSATKAGFVASKLVVALPQPAGASPLTVTMASVQVLNIKVTEARIRAQNELSETGASKYTMTKQDIDNLPAGRFTPINDVLTQMPGVSIDENQKVHVRGTQSPQFQYRIDGIMLPLDINNNPPFIQMLNSFFIKKISLLDGILPSRYSYYTGGVVDIQTKDGCADKQSSNIGVYGGQRETIQPSFELTGCHGKFSYYLTGFYKHSNLGFSQATPGPTPIHNYTNQGQGFGYFSYHLNSKMRLSLITAVTVNNSQFPNRPGLLPLYQLYNINPATYPSTMINSNLNQRDAFSILSLSGALTSNLSYQLAYTTHYISLDFVPDKIGDLIYQGVSPHVFHYDFDNTLQGDVTYHLGMSHTVDAGFYVGEYGTQSENQTMVFPADAVGQTSNTPFKVSNNVNQINMLYGVYLEDTWQMTRKLRVNYGLRFDRITGFTYGSQLSPSINFLYQLRRDTSLHAGFARYFQVPNFQGISPNNLTAFANTTAAVPQLGNPYPVTEHDYYWDVGMLHRLTEHLNYGLDTYYQLNEHYLDTGQFGFIPIYAPFNYVRGYSWGVENSVTYNTKNLSLRGALTVGRNMDKGLATGQFNFDRAESNFIDKNFIVLDHEPLYSVSGGAAYHWGPYYFGVDNVFSSGYRAGFANQEQLPVVWQVNLSVARTFTIPKIGEVNDRLVLINAFDRVNELRSGEGIGVFQPAYGPRIAIYNAITIPIPSL